MRRHNIPTADYNVFHNFDTAKSFVESCGDKRMVIKASGLTAGKGIIITQSTKQALRALEEIVEEFGPLNLCWPIIIEDYLSGPEFSVIALTDGLNFKTFPPIRDYKRLQEGNEGPNTGGMGCYAPTPLCNSKMLQDIENTVIKATIEGIKAEGKQIKTVFPNKADLSIFRE
jgi:phosphoribosylamine-glycine ligase